MARRPRKRIGTHASTVSETANEIALQLAMTYTERRGFVAIEGSYHGNSIGTMAVAEGEGLPDCRQLKPPLDEDAIARLAKLLRARKTAAVILEPIICNLGVLIPNA